MNPTLNIPTFRLSNGVPIPCIGLGTSKINNNLLEIQNAIKFAIKSGYRYIDCAWIYFIDSLVKDAINLEIIESDHQLKRNHLFLTMKLWNHHHSRSMVGKAINTSLKNLGVEYFDLYMINSPCGFKENPFSFPGDPYPRDPKNDNILFSDEMEKFVKNGTIKGLGLCNFSIAQVEDVLKHCEIKPVAHQIEVHPYFQNDKLVNFCRNNNIAIIAYSPLADCVNCQDIPNLLEDETLIKIGKKYSKTPAQVCLRWHYQRGIVTIPRSLEKDKIIENAHIFDFSLSDYDMIEIKNMNRNLRIHKSKKLIQHPFYPFRDD